MMEYKVYNCEADFLSAPYNEMKSYHWESDPPYRPAVFCKLGVVGDTLTSFLKCYEISPRAVYTKRDDPMYLDSCLELFVAPVEGRAEYVNVESNSNGAFLCEFGDGKYNRRLSADLTPLSPQVTSFRGADEKGAFWGVKVELSKEFICSLYDCSNFEYGSIRANFYKCGDDCEKPHYIAFAPVNTLPPGFHNPECFVEIKRSL